MLPKSLLHGWTVSALVFLGIWFQVTTAVASERGTPWKRHTVDGASRGADGTRLADANGDGLPDIVTGWEEGGQVRICLHPGPQAVRFPWPSISVGRAGNVEDAVWMDLDQDGHLDVISASEGKTRGLSVHWNPGPSALLRPDDWKTDIFPSSKGMMMWMYSLPARIDGDSHTDFFAGGKGPGAQIGWWRHPGKHPRDLSAWTWKALRPVGWIMSLESWDMDLDGDVDLIFSDRKGNRRGVFWLENPRSSLVSTNTDWKEHPIGGQDEEVMFVSRADLDGDGKMDWLTAVRPSQLALFQNLGHGQWKTHRLALPDWAGQSKAVTAGDLDGDGDLDLAVTCEHAEKSLSGVFWLEQTGSSPWESSWKPHDVEGEIGTKHDLVPLLDLDGDGDLDILTCEERENLGVIWFENPSR